MSTITRIPGGVCAAQGFTANGIHCGIRKNKTKHDLSVIYSDTRAATACVYTTNRVKGAPLTVTKTFPLIGNHCSQLLYKTRKRTERI